MFSGVLIELLGVRTSFQSYAVVAVLLCLTLLVMYLVTERRKDGDSDVEYQPLPQNNTELGRDGEISDEITNE